MQARESSPVRDRRSTAELHRTLLTYLLTEGLSCRQDGVTCRNLVARAYPSLLAARRLIKMKTTSLLCVRQSISPATTTANYRSRTCRAGCVGCPLMPRAERRRSCPAAVASRAGATDVPRERLFRHETTSLRPPVSAECMHDHAWRPRSHANIACNVYTD